MTEKKKGGQRTLVFGSRGSGAFDFREYLQEYLQGEEPGAVVETTSDVTIIRRAFFDEDGQGSRNLPRRVVLFPEMRQHGDNNLGMTVDTEGDGVAKDVQAMCDGFGVPLVRMKGKRRR